MLRLLALLLIASLSPAQDIRVEVRENEIRAIHNGHSKQLTTDGRSKSQALLSVNRDRIAYYEECPQDEHCVPSVVVLNVDGNRLQAFHPMSKAFGETTPCMSILNIMWIWDKTIGVECHMNPSLSEFIETDLTTETVVQDLLGYGFTPSPDGKQIAHVGPVIHFAPPYAQSNFLLIDDTTVYPLPAGRKPFSSKSAEPPIDMVRQVGSRYMGIHQITPRFSWSPDSKRVAFFDCIYDWVETGQDQGGGSIGTARNNYCSIAVVSTNGTLALFPLRDPGLDLNQAHLSWPDNRQVLMQVTQVVNTSFRIP